MIPFIRYTLTLVVLINVYLGHMWAVLLGFVLVTVYTEMSGITIATLMEHQRRITENIDKLLEIMEERRREDARTK